MANPPKKKGTAGETELLKLLPAYAQRTSAGMNYDIYVPGGTDVTFRPTEVLATRPDRGRWLVTLDLDAFLRMYYDTTQDYDLRPHLKIEVKRYKRFALHTIFEQKFGGTSEQA